MTVIPVPDFKNLFLEDPVGEKFWTHWMGAERFQAFRAHFLAMGESGAKAGLEQMKIFTQMEFRAATADDTQSRQQSVYTNVTPSSIAVRG